MLFTSLNVEQKKSKWCLMTQCKLYEIQILMPTNKALLDYIHASSLTYCLWLLLGYDD